MCLNCPICNRYQNLVVKYIYIYILYAKIQRSMNVGLFFTLIVSRAKSESVPQTHEFGSKSFYPEEIFKVTEIKQLCYFSI